jgi:hypothetical protein
MQAKRWQAQAAHAEATGEGRSHPAAARRNGLNACEWSRAAHGSISTASHALQVSKPTASRDVALIRSIHRQFERMFCRNFDAKRDRVVWTWNWDHYGFITRESRHVGHRKPVGHFPFDTRKQETEESYCGFDQSSWQNIDPFSHMSTWELIRTYGRVLKMRERFRIRPKLF